LNRNVIPLIYGTLFRLSTRFVLRQRAKSQDAAIAPDESPGRAVRADAQRSVDALLEAAKEVFVTSGVDAPVREIAEKAGVGIGTVYRHFPQRSDLIFAVSRREIDACADAAPVLLAERKPFDALAAWMQRYAAFIAAKRGLAKALHSGDPAFDSLPAHFDQRLRPALRTLLAAASAAGEIRADVNADDLLAAAASLCMSTHYDGPGRAERMVALLVDGLRYRPEPPRAGAPRSGTPRAGAPRKRPPRISR
jgi:AcrR family transcriptional regulator